MNVIYIAIFLLIVCRIDLKVVAQPGDTNTYMYARDIKEISGLNEDDLPTASSGASIPSFVEFKSNDGMTLRVDTDTLLTKQAGPLDAKVRYRESMQTSTFVDVPGCLLESMLNYYRYDVLICPSKEKMNPTICRLALNEYLPGVEPRAPSTKKPTEIIMTTRFSGIGVIAPAEYTDWIESTFRQISTASQKEPSKVFHNIAFMWWNVKETEFDFHKIHMGLIRNAPDGYRVFTSDSSVVNDRRQVILRVEEVDW